MRLLFCFSLSLLVHLCHAQDWKPGLVYLMDSTVFSGEFSLESFGQLEVVRHKKESGQNTYPIDKVYQLSVWDSELKDSIVYKRLPFESEQLKVAPEILFEVIYESDSIKILRKDVQSLERFFRVIPLPGLFVLVTWGKRLREREVLLMTDYDMNNLTIINDPKNGNDYERTAIKVDLILSKFMSKHRDEINTYRKEHKLKWNRIDHLVQITEYYDSLD